MQFRRILLVAMAALSSVTLLMPQGLVPVASAAGRAGDAIVMTPFQMSATKRLSRTRNSGLRTNAGGDPDTVWIGHINSPGVGAPGTVGGAAPFNIGRGPRLPLGGGHITSPASSFDGIWDFDARRAGEADSAQGWSAFQLPYGSVGSFQTADHNRPMMGQDWGNYANHVGRTANERSWGVVGVWHRDPGSNVPGLPDTGSVVPGPDVEWAPLADGFSAWCGLRGYGDLSVSDATAQGGTGNPFNSQSLDFQGNVTITQVNSLSLEGSDKNFPGYASQWDQILYTDLTVTAGQNLNISFLWRTNMSTSRVTDVQTKVGWFDGDPLGRARAQSAANTSAHVTGNFISVNAAETALLQPPVDSFMVYIGVPVVSDGIDNDNDFVAADGNSYDIYDEKRRWWSEVIARNGPKAELMAVAGVNATQTAGLNVASGDAILTAIRAAASNKVRLAFRVKTNRGFDDQTFGELGFSSGTAGAAIIDNVTATGMAAGIGDFEQAADIDNRPAAQADPSTCFKSTGKAPGRFFHVHELQGNVPQQYGALVYEDPCGPIGGAGRLCNMIRGVFTAGDHDNVEKSGGPYSGNSQDRQHIAVSPSINLTGTGPNTYNDIGLDDEIIQREHYVGQFDLFANVFFQTGNTGNGIRQGWSWYPSRQRNGLNVWGDIRRTILFNVFTVRGGIEVVVIGGDAQNDALLLSTGSRTHPVTGDAIPDSLRHVIEHLTRCFRLPAVTEALCSPISGANAGGYLDNISIGFARDSGSPPTLALDVGNLFNDAFPVRSTDANPDPDPTLTPPFASFDTMAAQVRSGFNIGLQTGSLVPGLQRGSIAGDSIVVTGPGNDVRVDVVFRVLPGVGNYRTVGCRNSGLRKRPDLGGGAGNAATAGDGSWWGAWMADNGGVGTGGNGTSGPGHAGGVWDIHRWNSARIDTSQTMLFDCDGLQGNLSNLQLGFYMSTYHEQDPKYATQGIPKNRCFIIDPNTQDTDQDNITCGLGTYPPTWTANASSGFNANEIIGQAGKTFEATKIIPDGQLTPGAHVQWFARKSSASTPLVNPELAPDTFDIFPQVALGPSFDGERWEHFGVLPDRWKDATFGGPGMACMIVIDVTSRNGDEIAWVSVADSIGLTSAARKGAHNGWTARGDEDVALGVNPASVPAGIPAMAVRAHGGQPGTVWDLFQQNAGESNFSAGSIGTRQAARAGGLFEPNGPGQANKYTYAGPTKPMLRTFYNAMVILGDGVAGDQIGPFVDQTHDDIAVYADWFTNSLPDGPAESRAVLMMSSDAVFGQETSPTGHPGFFPTHFGADDRNNDYRALSKNADDQPDLNLLAPAYTSGAILGVFSSCLSLRDVYTVAAGSAAATYEDAGTNPASPGPYVASVNFPPGGARFLNSIVFGSSPFMGSRYTLTTPGQRSYFVQTLTTLFAAINCGPAGNPVDVGDIPGSGAPFVNFMSLRSENPVRGQAKIEFGLVKTEKVEVKVYDVTGRLVKTVSNRVFEGGKVHNLTWDGTDDTGSKVAAGVYFYQLRSLSFVSQKKLAVLRN